MDIHVKKSTDPKGKNIRLIIPMGHGEFVFKNPNLMEIVKRMGLKIRYQQSRIKQLEAANEQLLAEITRVQQEAERDVGVIENLKTLVETLLNGVDV